MKLKLGRTISHSPFVDKDSITAAFSACGEFRYNLKFQYENVLKGDRVCVILMNPSAASPEFADNTVRRVEECIRLYFKGVKQVVIVNLFARRGMNPADIGLMFKKSGDEAVIGPKNDKYIREAIETSNHVVCAWGGPSGIDKDLHSQRVKAVNQMINASEGRCHIFRVFGGKYLPDAPHPLHGRIWGKNYKLHLIPIKSNKKWAA
ncbi:MAG: DUF1643 domain-containing protein [Bacteriovoracaceae bacterium]|nr:DUF1643 domain-containing protein [Bacteriovoracaceae bacterium]